MKVQNKNAGKITYQLRAIDEFFDLINMVWKRNAFASKCNC